MLIKCLLNLCIHPTDIYCARNHSRPRDCIWSIAHGPNTSMALCLNMALCLLPINKDLLEHTYVHSFTCSLWPLSCCNSRVEKLWKGPYGLQSWKYLLSGLHSKCAIPCFMPVVPKLVCTFESSGKRQNTIDCISPVEIEIQLFWLHFGIYHRCPGDSTVQPTSRTTILHNEVCSSWL